MLYVLITLLVCLLYLQQHRVIIWPVSAGAPNPAFANYTRSFIEWIKLRQILFPIANKITFVLFILAARLWSLGFMIPTTVLWATACTVSIVAYAFVFFRKPSLEAFGL